MQDYYNPLVTGVNNIQRPDVDYFDRTMNPRMAWHDVHTVCTLFLLLAVRSVTSSLTQPTPSPA
jgi:hypothetical protein